MKNLTAADRGSIETLLQEQYTNKQIALRLGIHSSTVSREIKKGLDGSGIYHAWIAQVSYDVNRKRCRQIPKLDHPANHRLRGWIVSCLQKGWDPSMISGRMKAEGFLAVCAETFYQWIYGSPGLLPRYRTECRSMIVLPSWRRKLVLVTGRATVLSILTNTP
ncbi:MAG: helix-turn-helix domain-containing protein [Candidatus Saccharimonadales bacterium]